MGDSAVYLADNAYYIMFHTYAPGIGWVRIGDKDYHDHVCGMVRSEDTVHKIKVPAHVLDEVGAYTINFRKIIDRCPYFPKSEEEVESRDYTFRSPKGREKTNLYLLGDVHDRHQPGVDVGSYFGDDLDILVLLGDTSENGTRDGAMDAQRIAADITRGEVATLYVHGNHEARGRFSTELRHYVGVGDVFHYTFHTDNIYGIVLDAGEDKFDQSREYGGLAVFDEYRREQIAFLDEVIAKGEYKNYEHVLVFLHIPLIQKRNEPMKDIYYEWIKRLNHIAPEVMLCAHEHVVQFIEPGSDFFGMKQEYPVVAVSVHEGEWVDDMRCRLLDLAGMAMTVTKDKLDFVVTDMEHKERERYSIDLTGRNP